MAARAPRYEPPIPITIRTSLSDFIFRKYEVKLGVRQCQRLFHQLGFSQIRPQAFPSKDHEEDPSRGELKKN